MGGICPYTTAAEAASTTTVLVAVIINIKIKSRGGAASGAIYFLGFSSYSASAVLSSFFSPPSELEEESPEFL
jgi:hypothetical protein